MPDSEDFVPMSPNPDIPSSEGDVQESGPTSEQVTELRTALVEQNKHLLAQLQLLGQQVSPFAQIQCEMQALVDFVFDDGAAREQYETAVEFRFNAMLKAAMARILGNVDEGG
jgi:hypothetical protein